MAIARKIRLHLWTKILIFGIVISGCTSIPGSKVSTNTQKISELTNSTTDYSTPDVDSKTLRKDIARFKRIVLAKNGRLSPADWRLHDKLLNQYIALKNSNIKAFQIPAHSRVTRQFLTFCLNPTNFAPSDNTKFRWAKGRTEIPYLNELLSVFAKNKDLSQQDIQEAIWNLKDEAPWEQYPNRIKRLLLSIDPDAAFKLPSNLKSQATNEATNFLLNQIPGLAEVKDTADQLKGRYYDYKSLAASIHPIAGDSTDMGDDEAAELPGSNVYASTESDSYSLQKVIFYNPTNHSVTLDLTKYHLEPVNNSVQRIAFGRTYDGSDSDRLISALEDGLFSTMLRVGIGFTPGLSDVADIYELLLGEDFVSGRPLTAMDRTLAGIELMSGTGMGERYVDRAINAPEQYVSDFERGFSAIGQKELRLENVDRDEVARFMSEAKSDAIERAGSADQITRFNPTTHAGPLSEIRAGDQTVADTFRSSSYIQYENRDTETLYRVQNLPYSEDGRVGNFWTRVKPEGPTQAALDSALHPEFRNGGTRWLQAEVPPGQQIFEGIAGPQKGMLGGGNQVYIENFNPKWIVKQGKF